MARQDAGENHDKRNKRVEQKAARTRRNARGGFFQLTLQHWKLITVLGAMMVEQEGALRIGLTRDGGALALGMYLGDDYVTEYVRPSEDFYTALQEIAAAWITDGAEAFAVNAASTPNWDC